MTVGARRVLVPLAVLAVVVATRGRPGRRRRYQRPPAPRRPYCENAQESARELLDRGDPFTVINSDAPTALVPGARSLTTGPTGSSASSAPRRWSSTTRSRLLPVHRSVGHPGTDLGHDGSHERLHPWGARLPGVHGGGAGRAGRPSHRMSPSSRREAVSGGKLPRTVVVEHDEVVRYPHRLVSTSGARWSEGLERKRFTMTRLSGGCRRRGSRRRRPERRAPRRRPRGRRRRR